MLTRRGLVIVNVGSRLTEFIVGGPTMHKADIRMAVAGEWG